MVAINTLEKSELMKGQAEVINNFSITVATVNGSGSQTSNLTLLRAIFKMGVPVSGKNMFPSNIQGMPTSYTIRVSKDGFIARREENEIIVAMNPTTFTKDVESLCPVGALFYPDDIKIPISRDDIVSYPMPVKQVVRNLGIPAERRDYVSNMVYVGVLAQILNIDIDKIYMALDFHFKGKKAPIDMNFEVIKVSAQWAAENLIKTDPYRIEPLDLTSGYIMADGNTAGALGAIYGGVQFVGWYPITPATTMPEIIQEYLPQLRKDPITGKNTFAVVQAEDELAAIGMVIGAGWGGLRAMTSTSGPGLSLMTEYIGLAYYAEVPIVVWNVQRVGPSTGLPTRTAQGDLTFSYFMGHGDTENIILLPGSVNECFEFGWKAFDIAERIQTPVIIQSDLDFGMNQWMTEPFKYPDTPMDRGKVFWEEDIERLKGEWGRYRDIDGDGIPYRTLPGNRHPLAAYLARGTGHDENGRYSEDPENWHDLLERLKKKFKVAKEICPKPIITQDANNEIGIIAFGSTEPAVFEARHLLWEQGISCDVMRIRSIPFSKEVGEFIRNHDRNYVVELNRDGQLNQLLILECPDWATHLISLAYTDGLPITAKYIINSMMEHEENNHG